MKRSKFDKITTMIFWILLFLNIVIVIISIAKWYTYLMILLDIVMIIWISGKTYRRKLIALFLFSLIKLNKKYSQRGGFCGLIKNSLNLKANSSIHLFLTNWIEYIKPINLNIAFVDPTMQFIGFWFNPCDWDIRIKYLKSILKE